MSRHPLPNPKTARGRFTGNEGIPWYSEIHVGSFGMGVRASFFKPTPIIYFVFEIDDLFIYLIEQNIYIFIYCSLIFIYTHCCL